MDYSLLKGKTKSEKLMEKLKRQHIKSSLERFKNRVSMPKKDFVKEHEHLTKVLKTGKGLKEEYNKQEKELKEYK